MSREEVETLAAELDAVLNTAPASSTTGPLTIIFQRGEKVTRYAAVDGAFEGPAGELLRRLESAFAADAPLPERPWRDEK